LDGNWGDEGCSSGGGAKKKVEKEAAGDFHRVRGGGGLFLASKERIFYGRIRDKRL